MLAAKTKKPEREKIAPAVRQKALHEVAPWTCVHFDDRSEIKAYVMAAGGWETIATIAQNSAIDAEATANFIARAVNDHARMQNIITELAAALEPCVGCGALSWQAEHEADTALAHARQEGLTG